MTEVRAFLGAEPVTSKLGIVVKCTTTPDTQKQRKKIRLIIDSKQSGVSLVATRTHRSILPRAIHVVADLWGFMSLPHWESRYTEEIELLIADISDAFWLPLLHPFALGAEGVFSQFNAQ